MSQPSTITAVVFDRILAFLTPLFLDVVAGDTEAARQAARALLDSYEARTNRELRLAALSIAFGFGALDALSRAVDPALLVGQVLRLRGNANALSRSAVQNETLLNKLHRHPPEAQDAAAEPLPASTATADLLSFVRAPVTQHTPPKASVTAHAAVMSRQQRRAAERQAEKQRRRQQEEARRAQRATAIALQKGTTAAAAV